MLLPESTQYDLSMQTHSGEPADKRRVESVSARNGFLALYPVTATTAVTGMESGIVMETKSKILVSTPVSYLCL